jgi:hypothetical protein
MTDALKVVLIALLVLAPLILVALLGRYWIQRAPTDKAARLRRKVFLICLVGALGLWSSRELISESKFWRRVSGTCSIVLFNNSGSDVRDLEMALRSQGEHQPDVNHDESMPHRSRREITTRAEELKVERLTGAVGSDRFSFVGAAKKGERLVITIEAGGRIVTRVE